MLKARRIEIAFGVLYIVLMAIIMLSIPSLSISGEEVVVVIAEEEEVVEEGPEVFVVTAYCSCYDCCGKYALNRPEGIVYGASGHELIPDYSVAVDPNIIPYGTILIIDGKEYIAHDTGGAIKGNKIDLYMADHDDAKEWGIQAKEVFIQEVRK